MIKYNKTENEHKGNDLHGKYLVMKRDEKGEWIATISDEKPDNTPCVGTVTIIEVSHN